MNTLAIESNGALVKRLTITNWATLTRDDLHYVKGEHNEWYARIEKRIGETRQSIESAIEDLFSSRS
jgi:hypothetical protein